MESRRGRSGGLTLFRIFVFGAAIGWMRGDSIEFIYYFVYEAVRVLFLCFSIY